MSYIFPYKVGKLELGHGKYDIFIETKKPPFKVFVEFLDHFHPTCAPHETDTCDVKIIKGGFILSFDIKGSSRKIEFFSI